jgi:TRAP-type mannitol/chloroaromatic compound transport system permease small subunit
LTLREIEKSGAILSTIGLVLLIVFIIVLLAFPIIKYCPKPYNKCEFYSSAPDSIRFVVRPIFLAFTLMIIAIGVSTTRFAVWYQYRKMKKNT